MFFCSFNPSSNLQSAALRYICVFTRIGCRVRDMLCSVRDYELTYRNVCWDLAVESEKHMLGDKIKSTEFVL